MEEKNQSGIIPENHLGKVIDTADSVDFDSIEQATAFYAVVSDRLLRVNAWHTLAGGGTAEFQLVDAAGGQVDRPASQGDYFRIDVPGPGPAAGGGYDWVIVEQVSSVSQSGMQSLGMRVRPSPPPGDPGGPVAHFYSEASTSSFTVTREGRRVTAGIYDRNARPNPEGGLVDRVRHLAFGLGAVTGFSKYQWHRLVRGLLMLNA